MNSKIAEYIKLGNEPVAVIKSSTCPEGALQFKEGKWGCVVSMINAAAKGRSAALTEATVACPGGKGGTGFKPLEPGFIEYFLSVGGKGPKEGEFYKESPELARDYVEKMPRIEAKEYLVLKPLSEVSGDDKINSVVFLVNADQLSALITLANYDQKAEGDVSIRFGAGCAQSLLFSMADEDEGKGTCTIGLTDPSARACIDKNTLSFSIPYSRFQEMEAKADGSFLSKATWQKLSERL